jgi:DNA-directed RNA polymerase specialized sigma subunit
MMTTKEVKQWLWRARWIDKELASLQETRDREYERITSITAQLSGMTVSGTKDPHKFDRFAELENTIELRKSELIAAKNEVLYAIGLLEDPRYREVLKRYYVDCQSLEEIAIKTNYSFPHVKRLKYQAINAIKMVLE